MTIGTDVLYSDTFTGANGTAIGAPWTMKGGSSFEIQSNAAVPVAGSSPYSMAINPTRANDNYSVSFTLPGYPGQSRPTEGILMRRSDGTGGTNNGYIVGADDSSDACIWKITNGTTTLLAGPTNWGALLQSTLTASIDGNVLTLSNSTDGTTLSVTDSTYASGDLGWYVAGTGPAIDNVVIKGTAVGGVVLQPPLNKGAMNVMVSM